MAKEVGQTNNPTELIPGNAATVNKTLAVMRDYGKALHQAGSGLKIIDTVDGWRGPAGDAFRERFDGAPEKWLEAGDSFLDAATALESFQVTLTWAQGQAGMAIQQWNDAQTATDQARAQHNQDEQAAGHGLPFNDPGEPGRQAARDTLSNARNQLASAGDTAAGVVGTARDRAPEEPGFWSGVGDFFEDVGAGLLNAGGAVVNGVASFGNAAINHPELALTTVAGVGIAAIGVTGEVGGIALDATGVGAVAGVPLNVASAGLIATGVGMAGIGAGGLIMHAASDDAVEPLETDHAGSEDDEYVETEGFRESEYTQDEIEQFIKGHTGDNNPTMNRPSEQQVREVLNNAQPQRLERQNVEEFVHTVNGERIRVIVNYDMPWRSTAYKIGQ